MPAGISYVLQRRITEAVDQSVDLLACLAVGALLIIVALIVGDIVDGVDGADRIACHLVHGPVDGRNACHPAAVIVDGLDGALGGKAGGNGSHQHQHMLTADHRLNIVPDDQAILSR